MILSNPARYPAIQLRSQRAKQPSMGQDVPADDSLLSIVKYRLSPRSERWWSQRGGRSCTITSKQRRPISTGLSTAFGLPRRISRLGMLLGCCNPWTAKSGAAQPIDLRGWRNRSSECMRCLLRIVTRSQRYAPLSCSIPRLLLVLMPLLAPSVEKYLLSWRVG